MANLTLERILGMNSLIDPPDKCIEARHDAGAEHEWKRNQGFVRDSRLSGSQVVEQDYRFLRKPR